MPTTDPFERFADRYEEWFERHDPTYRSELSAVRELLPGEGLGLEVGVGSARFAGPLGIEVGVDPAGEMLALARERGIETALAVGEALPFRTDSFARALVVTTICFFDDVAAALGEIRRVLRPGGSLVIGFVDRESYLGQVYQEQQDENPFYRDATFYSAGEVEDLLADAGFEDLAWVQTVFDPPGTADDPEPVRVGHGEGSFVVVRGTVPGE